MVLNNESIVILSLLGFFLFVAGIYSGLYFWGRSRTAKEEENLASLEARRERRAQGRTTEKKTELTDKKPQPEEEKEKPTPPWELALRKSREPLLTRLRDAFVELTAPQPWNPAHPLWERLEETLLAADLGPSMTERLLKALQQDLREKPSPEELKNKLREKMLAVFEAVPISPIPVTSPFVTLLIGVNGAGKTTTAGKLAAQAKANGKKVVLGAGDTFRAAAVEQLKTWADRLGVECILPAQGANPAAVAFDTIAAGISGNADEVIIDTAGRLHTKENLMEELRKVVRVIQKKIPDAPHRVLLVLDATLGQNALIQAKEFSLAVRPTGIVLTKLDGSAKGGAAFAVSADLGLPVSFVGTGETAADLRAFSASEFVKNLVP